MQWLIAHMWTALAATGVLGLLFGWAVRGLRLRGRLRKAEGERNIAQGTLTEKEAELEALYAAGRAPAGDGEVTVPAASNDIELRGALAERDEKLQALTDELARSKAELSDLRAQASEAGDQDISATAVGTAVAGMAAGAVLASDTDDKDTDRLDANIDQEEATLEWRNRYLESRVRTLQQKVTDLSDTSNKAGDGETVIAAAAPAAVASVAASEEDRAPATGNVEMEKLKWKANYLKERLNYVEKYGLPGLASGAGIVAAAQSTAKPAEDTEPESGGTSDEEIASLRWRNRYLEGRLAYYEGDKAIADDGDSGVEQLAESAAALAVSADLDGPEDIAPSEVQIAIDDIDDAPAEADIDPDINLDAPEEVGLEVEAAPVIVQDDGDTPEDDTGDEDADADARGIKPMALEGPVDGEGDDLTAIGGIGPKIQEVLNGFGVFHYDQIAAWTAENVEWVDDHLAFEGRIEREQWVQQAEALSNVG